MKSLYLVLSALISLNSWSSAESFEKYIGCYKTITFNGSRVPEEATGQGQSVIEMRTGSYLFKDLNGSEIPSVSLLLFQGQDGELLHFDVAEAYLDRGTFTDFSKSARFTFSGELAHRNDPSMTYVLKSNILITPLAPKRIQVRTTRETIFSETNVYVLQAVNCSL